MPAPHEALAPAISAAIETAFGRDFAGVDPVLRPSQFADAQANAPLALAKRLRMPPRDAAARIIDGLGDSLEGICASVEVSGPGFINLQLSNAWIAAAVQQVAADPRCGVPTVPADTAQTVPIDYSAPNVAKEMHVGHLRTTVVGDSLARSLEFLGHTVIRQNHIGDWGTPFGMLVEHLVDVGPGSPEAELVETDPNAFYQAAREKFDGSADFADRARSRVVALQGGDVETLRLWGQLLDLSKQYFHRIYEALDVSLTDADLAGESTYNDELAGICAELQQRGIAVDSDGALCVFLDGYTGREGKPVPLIIRKSDGGYGYATTDLATVKYRVERLGADRILYVIGAAQALHLQMVFATARLAGWLPDDVEVVHVQIGNVLGEDRKILRTRAGSTLRLMSLIEEAVDASRRVLDEARPDLPDETRAGLAREIGVGAIKYADLSVAHDSEYVFDLERMVALTGNTGPYLQYAAARVRSLFREAGLAVEAGSRQVVIAEPAERVLALKLIDFGATVEQVGRDLEPHRLCGYLFELAQAFSVFWEQCPVLKAPEPAREARLALAGTTLRVMETGLGLLGIRTPEQM